MTNPATYAGLLFAKRSSMTPKAPLVVGREVAFKQQILPQHLARRIVHVQHVHGDDTGLGLPHERGGFPAEAAFPVLLSGMKQSDEVPFRCPLFLPEVAALLGAIP